jgi:hypothetical protein
MKNIFEIIKGTVYPFDVLVSVNQTDDEFYSEVGHLSDDYLDEVFLNLNETILARSYMTKNNISIVRFINIDKDNLPHGLISHELFHVTTFILNKANIEFSFKTDEAYAYLLHYLIDEVYSIFNRNVK